MNVQRPIDALRGCAAHLAVVLGVGGLISTTSACGRLANDGRLPEPALDASPGSQQEAGGAGGGDSSSRGGTPGAGGRDSEVVLPEGELSYRLTRQKILLPPIPDPSAITFDGTHFWLISTEYVTFVTTLVRWEEGSSQVERSFTYPDLIPVRVGAHGLGWDGSSLWVSKSGEGSSLVQIQPEDGTVLSSIGSPVQVGPAEIDFFGSWMWLSNGTGTVYRMDLSSRSVESSFPVAYDRDRGIAVRSGEAWVAGLFGGLSVYDPFTGAPGPTVEAPPEEQTVHGALCFAGDRLVSVEERGLVFYTLER